MTDEPAPGEVVGQLAAAAADGAEVDWRAARVAHPGHQRVIDQLEIISRITQVHRHSPAEPPSTHPSASSTAPAGGTGDSAAPAEWGPLQIAWEIGRGSYGRVFRAWEPRLERHVALKLLDRIPPGAERTAVAEARLLAQIRHDNVVTVFGADQFDGRIGFWMECIEGRTLLQIHDDYGTLSAPEALLVATDLCRALAAVHRAGYVHGDVKVHNVMRQVGGRIVLMDFGAARLLRLTSDTGPRTVTPLYAAPEVLLGAEPTIASDLYSLGVLLYFLVSGRYPVTGGNLDEIRRAHHRGPRRLLRDARPDLPPSFIAVVDAAIAPIPEDRPDSAGALEALIERASGRVRATHVGRQASPSTAAGHSIAIVPFADLSADGSLRYFCEGLAEEIIDALAGTPSLRVVPRSTAFAAEARVSETAQIGAALNVSHVLRGSVRAAGSQLRVTVRLTDAATDEQIWSERFARELADIFGVQDEIAAAVARALGLRLSTPAATAAAVASPPAPDAYTLYLKGRYCWNQRTEMALQRSAAYFEAALEKEPEYAAAYVALAEAYTTLGLYGVVAPHDIMPRAKSTVRRALALAEDSAAAHATAACIAAVYDWQWHDAALGYQRAINASPGAPSAHHWYAINYLVPLRRFEEAEIELQRAAEADPLSMPIRASVGMRSYFAHDFGRAVRELRECLDLDPGSTTARLFLGLTFVELKRYDDALLELGTASQMAGSPEITAAIAYAHGRAGNADHARALLNSLLAQARRRYVSASLIAQIHAGLGSIDEAADALYRACDEHATDLAWLGVRPVFDGLRADARYEALLTRMHQ